MNEASEFGCEVVRVTTVAPHPNADKLVVCRITRDGAPAESDYSIVHSKAEAPAPGALMVHVTPGAMVPLAHPEFSFLSKRLDAKGKTMYRLKTARIRNVMSEGLLIPAPPAAKLGDDISSDLGVEKYLTPEERQEMASLAQARLKKPVRRGLFAWLRANVPDYSVVSLRKAPYHFDAGEPVVVTEKIHGTNFRFGWIRRRGLSGRLPGRAGWMFVVGSHHTFKVDTRPWYKRWFGPKWETSSWYGEDIYLEAAKDHNLAERTWDWRGYIFYGELYGHTKSGKAIQDLTYGPASEFQRKLRLRLFDLYNVEQRLFESPHVLSWAAADVQVNTVPVLWEGPFDLQGIKDLAEGPSAVPGADHIREGVVVHSGGLTEAKRGKYVADGYYNRE